MRGFVNNLLDLDSSKLFCFLFYINQVVINVTVPYILLKLITALMLLTRHRITHQFWASLGGSKFKIFFFIENCDYALILD